VKNDYRLFTGFEERGNKILNVLHEKALGHTSNKTLRKWNLSEVSELVGRTSHTIIKHINKGSIKKPESMANTQRIYSIEDINNIRDFFNTRPSRPDGKQAQILAFTNFKGGVAKTTSSVHAAHYFARAGYKVLFIDSDSQGSGTSSFGYAPDHHFSQEETILPLFTNFNYDIKKLIQKTYWDGLDLIPANLSLYNVELQVPIIGNKLNAAGKKYPSHAILHNSISKIKNEYDIIIIDCPPSMSFLNTNALYAADGLIIPCPPELPDVASMFQFF
jgi:chromosome partitioning protein